MSDTDRAYGADDIKQPYTGDWSNFYVLGWPPTRQETTVKMPIQRLVLLALSCIAVVSQALAQVSSKLPGNVPPVTHAAWLDHVSLYAMVFGGVLTGLGTLFGLPLALLTFKKTRAEIRGPGRIARWPLRWLLW